MEAKAAATRSVNEGMTLFIMEIRANDRSREGETGRYRTICISDLQTLQRRGISTEIRIEFGLAGKGLGNDKMKARGRPISLSSFPVVIGTIGTPGERVV